MTEARWVQTPDELAGLPRGTRGYVGHPTCRRAAWDWAERLPLHAPVTLALPPLRPRDEALLGALLRRLRRIPCEGLELSLNDWGTLACCARALAGTPVTLCAGVLLAGQDTDPRIAGFLTGADQPARNVTAPDGRPARLVYAPPPAQLKTHWQTPSILGAYPLLARWGVRRVECCIPPAGLSEDFPADLAVSLYAPRVVLSVSPCADCETCRAESRPLGVLGGRAVERSLNLVTYPAELPACLPQPVDRLVRF